jgi:hypothetical protein
VTSLKANLSPSRTTISPCKAYPRRCRSKGYGPAHALSAAAIQPDRGPQEQKASFGVTRLDCRAIGHTDGAFQLNPGDRPQAARFRIDTVSLRGMFNQRTHGSKRSLRSGEGFTEFERRTAYFEGDQVTAATKG